jgi:dTDP-4-amino-4,6-dideoxygalactose transaminase
MLFFSNPLAQFLAHETEISQAINDVLHANSYILGQKTKEFELAFAKYCNVDYAIGVGSGTDAITLGLKALGIGPGDEVITVSHTALASAAGILASGATPVLIDIDPDYYTMSPDLIKNSITKKTKAIMPVHLYGQPAMMDQILACAHEHGLYVIEDCAQAIGASYNNKKVGGIADIGCFSFYPTKNLGAIGDGGMITTNNKFLFDRILRLRQYGWDEDRNTLEPGINSRLDELQASVLNVKLKYLNEDNKAREKIAFFYSNFLKKSKGYKYPKLLENTKHVFHLYVIQSQERDRLLDLFSQDNIFPGIHYKTPVHKYGGYSKLIRTPKKGLPITEEIVNKIISLPIYPEIKQEDVERVVALLDENEHD